MLRNSSHYKPLFCAVQRRSLARRIAAIGKISESLLRNRKPPHLTATAYGNAGLPTATAPTVQFSECKHISNFHANSGCSGYPAFRWG